MGKMEFVQIAKDCAIGDVASSQDDFKSVVDKEELFDIADDAWCNTAIPFLEWAFLHDPSSKYRKLGIDINEAIEKYRLSKEYKDAFVNEVIRKFNLEL